MNAALIGGVSSSVAALRDMRPGRSGGALGARLSDVRTARTLLPFVRFMSYTFPYEDDHGYT